MVAAEKFVRSVEPFLEYRYLVFYRSSNIEIHSDQCTSRV